jgi:hypothetical protein
MTRHPSKLEGYRSPATYFVPRHWRVRRWDDGAPGHGQLPSTNHLQTGGTLGARRIPPDTAGPGQAPGPRGDNTPRRTRITKAELRGTPCTPGRTRSNAGRPDMGKLPGRTTYRQVAPRGHDVHYRTGLGQAPGSRRRRHSSEDSDQQCRPPGHTMRAGSHAAQRRAPGHGLPLGRTRAHPEYDVSLPDRSGPGSRTPEVSTQLGGLGSTVPTSGTCHVRRESRGATPGARAWPTAGADGVHPDTTYHYRTGLGQAPGPRRRRHSSEYSDQQCRPPGHTMYAGSHAAQRRAPGRGLLLGWATCSQVAPSGIRHSLQDRSGPGRSRTPGGSTQLRVLGSPVPGPGSSNARQTGHAVMGRAPGIMELGSITNFTGPAPEYHKSLLKGLPNSQGRFPKCHKTISEETQRKNPFIQPDSYIWVPSHNLYNSTRRKTPISIIGPTVISGLDSHKPCTIQS